MIFLKKIKNILCEIEMFKYVIKFSNNLSHNQFYIIYSHLIF